MGFDFIKKLPTPEEIRNQYPIDAEIQAVKDARDKELRDVFTGKSDKFLAIIGPCSADNEDAVLDYLTRLRNVQEKIADKVLIVPRVYTNKPSVWDTRVCCISRIRKRSRMYSQASSRCESSMQTPSSRPA